MVKKRVAKRQAKKGPVKQKAAKKTPKPKVPSLQDKEFMKRADALGLDLTPLLDEFLALVLEVGRKNSPGAMVILVQAALAAYYKAAQESDEPADWLKAARKAAQLD